MIIIALTLYLVCEAPRDLQYVERMSNATTVCDFIRDLGCPWGSPKQFPWQIRKGGMTVSTTIGWTEGLAKGNY